MAETDIPVTKQVTVPFNLRI